MAGVVTGAAAQFHPPEREVSPAAGPFLPPLEGEGELAIEGGES